MPEWALLTGATGGLGRALAHEAAQAGVNLVLSARSEPALDTMAQALRQQGIEVVSLAADLMNPGAADALWDAANDGRQISILLNNAGLGHFGRIQDPATLEADRATVAVDVAAAARLLKRAAIDMAARGRGHILNVASSAAFMPAPLMAHYHASKVFLLYLSEAAHRDLAGTGVAVTALCPGPVATGFFDAGDVNGALALRLLPKARAEKVARTGWRAMMAGRRRVVPGVLYKMIGFAMRFTPPGIALRLAEKYWSK